MNKQEIIELILAALQRQPFADWYNAGGRFDDWITGELKAPSEEEIKADIAKLFNIK